MITLGIESSCDETACAVLRNENELLSNIVATSLDKHKEFGGIVPEIASRETLKCIDAVYRKALEAAKIEQEEIDLIALTKGPGLIGSLLVGLSFGKALSYGLNIPFIGVSHLEAHLSGAFIDKKRPEAPFIGLVISGGHTSLVHSRDGRYVPIGATVDDAVGEAFDKVAKILGLGFPGGPIIDDLAKRGNPDAIKFTKPKLKNDFDFSYSGIKTAVLYYKKDLADWESRVNDICASFQKAAISWLVEKTMLACEKKKVGCVVVGGGVSANSLFREEIKKETKKRDYDLFLPELKFTNDNAAMIAKLGYEEFRRGRGSELNLGAVATMPLGE